MLYPRHAIPRPGREEVRGQGPRCAVEASPTAPPTVPRPKIEVPRRPVGGLPRERLLDGLIAAHGHADGSGDGSPGEPKGVTVEDLPSELTRLGMGGTLEVNVTTRSLGRWMANRRGRWAGDFTVREAGSVQGAKRWRIEKYEMRQEAVE